MQSFIAFLSNHLELSIAIGCVFILLVGVEFLRAKRKRAEVSPTLATQLINHQKAIVIDFRHPEQFRKGHIIDAVSLSYKDVLDNPKKLEKYQSRPLITVYAAGPEASKITAHLMKQGYAVHPLAGGIQGWINAQMPLIKESS